MDFPGKYDVMLILGKWRIFYFCHENHTHTHTHEKIFSSHLRILFNIVSHRFTHTKELIMMKISSKCEQSLKNFCK